jgi:signal transduction histidine kinase
MTPYTPERDNTDEGLRTERSHTDQSLELARTSVEEVADGIVLHAREKADAVLDEARDKADKASETPHPGPHDGGALAVERAAEDEVLAGERAAEDEALILEREARARILLKLLPMEREKTDQYLVTERARSDDSLAHRDDFLGAVSHDLRNLLGNVALIAHLLSMQASESDEGRRTVAEMARIERYVARMNRILGDLLDVVSIDAGKLAVHPQLSNLSELIAEAVNTFELLSSKKGISLVQESSKESLPAAFDHDRILQVLANLIANAIKFTAKGGMVTVRGERKGDQVLMSVIDTGTGIPSDKLEAVFERFWQVGEQDRRGLGLGLYISKCILAAHGGRIWVESKLGAGSAFHFTFPFVTATVQ